MTVIRGLAAVLSVAAIVAVSYGLVSTLPAPSAGDRLAVRVLERLDAARGTGGTMELAGRVVRVRCRRLPSHATLLDVGGDRLELIGTHVSVVRAPRARTLAAATRGAATAAAEADLSGSYLLYRSELAGVLERPGAVLLGRTRVGGRQAERIRLTGAPPDVELLVDAATLRPLAVRFRSRRLSGWTRLGPPARLTGRAGC